jgi:hypothetical protein
LIFGAEPHRPNENKIGYAFRERGLIEEKIN